MNIYSLLEKLAHSTTLNISLLKEQSAELQKAFASNDASYITTLFTFINGSVDVNHAYVTHCYVTQGCI
jgi:hypothetical protein